MKKWPLLSSSVLAHARRCDFMAQYAEDCIARLDTSVPAVVGLRLVPQALPAFGFYMFGNEVAIMTSETTVYRLSGEVEDLPAGTVLVFDPPTSPHDGGGVGVADGAIPRAPPGPALVQDGPAGPLVPNTPPTIPTTTTTTAAATTTTTTTNTTILLLPLLLLHPRLVFEPSLRPRECLCLKE